MVAACLVVRESPRSAAWRRESLIPTLRPTESLLRTLRALIDVPACCLSAARSMGSSESRCYATWCDAGNVHTTHHRPTPNSIHALPAGNSLPTCSLVYIPLAYEWATPLPIFPSSVPHQRMFRLFSSLYLMWLLVSYLWLWGYAPFLLVSCPNVIAPFVTHSHFGLHWWSVLGAVFCHLFIIICKVMYCVLERNGAPNV